MSHQKVKKEQSTLSSIIEFAGLLIIVFLIRTYGFGLYQVPTGSMETTILVGERFLSDKFTYNFRGPRRGEIIAMNDPEYQYSDNYFKSLFQRYVWGPQNWTKRIIGVPGDTIRGAIEDSKPVVYRNGEKLNELYINTYPLISELSQDQDVLIKVIEAEVKKLSRQYKLDQSMINQYVMERLSQEVLAPRSYDSSKPYDQQKFYKFDEKRVLHDAQGNPSLITPGTPLYPGNGKFSPDETRNNWNKSDVFFVKLGPDEYWGMGDNRLGSKDCRFFGPVKKEQIHGRIIFRLWSIDSNEGWWIVDLIKNPIDYWKRVRWSRCY
ncbi:MAG TPA: signal peptidase I, partial [Candidatus Babeliales bacterium]|nr:signal peptidase I [Candidatus Babeliales bacterium]